MKRSENGHKSDTERPKGTLGLHEGCLKTKYEQLMNVAAMSLQCHVNTDMKWICETVNCEYCCSVLYGLPYSSFYEGLMPTSSCTAALLLMSFSMSSYQPTVNNILHVEVQDIISRNSEI